MQYLGQANQDKFVLSVLKEKKNGYFLEIGSNHPININNSYLLETNFNWRGIMVEYNDSYLPSYKQVRPNSIHLIQDATTIDYKSVFERNNMPFAFDYLQIDLEADTGSTLQTLQNLDIQVFDKYKFATVTFEHDIYRTNFGNTRSVSRDIFNRRGYVRVFEDINDNGYPYEDWYVHPDLVDMNYVNTLINMNKQYYVNHPITGNTIKWQDIRYPSSE
jgi:hypothetical protein